MNLRKDERHSGRRAPDRLRTTQTMPRAGVRPPSADGDWRDRVPVQYRVEFSGPREAHNIRVMS
jgi:hypothetical protein